MPESKPFVSSLPRALHRNSKLVLTFSGTCFSESCWYLCNETMHTRELVSREKRESNTHGSEFWWK